MKPQSLFLPLGLAAYGMTTANANNAEPRDDLHIAKVGPNLDHSLRCLTTENPRVEALNFSRQQIRNAARIKLLRGSGLPESEQKAIVQDTMESLKDRGDHIPCWDARNALATATYYGKDNEPRRRVTPDATPSSHTPSKFSIAFTYVIAGWSVHHLYKRTIGQLRARQQLAAQQLNEIRKIKETLDKLLEFVDPILKGSNDQENAISENSVTPAVDQEGLTLVRLLLRGLTVFRSSLSEKDKENLHRVLDSLEKIKASDKELRILGDNGEYRSLNDNDFRLIADVIGELHRQLSAIEQTLNPT